ncbi:MAG TPA: PAS domain-containing sensor histidine kinase [Pricia antarctica]|uniref:histidine kinase n=2 Tax=root TaxID=1 RepID=A0A831QJQ6_9FLAO|nr:PAS domain-containing sensor histidine kinase [Pricia antarctica]
MIKKYYEIQTVPLPLSDENEPKILYLSQDVTEDRKNRLMLDAALQAAKLVVFEYNFYNDLITGNDALRELFEFDTEKPIKLNDIDQKLHPEDKSKWKSILKKGIKTGEFHEEFRLQLKNGTKHIRVTGKIQFDIDKFPQSAIATVLDITEDKQLLYKISESEERFRRIADSAPVTIWITDGDDKCTYINQTWLEYTGSDLEDCLNDGWLKYIHPEDRRRAMESFLVASEEREAFELEYMVQGKDGSYGWFLNRAHPRFDEDGTFDGFVGVNINITEQKEFSQELKKQVAERTDELEKSNEELVKLNMNLEEYAHVASHDLQEPVRKIRTFNSLLLDKKDDVETVAKYGEKIEKSAERMTNLIRNILDYSRLREGQSGLEFLDLDEILEELESDLELMIEENDVNISSGKLGTIYGVKIQIFQLFANLVRNSIKFNSNKPSISITASTIKGEKIEAGFNAEVETKYKKLTFVDNGIGFANDQRETIFKPFKRLHSRNEYSGTGIGLAICKRIVDFHQGFIDVKSEEGKGSEFSVYFPIESEK